MRTKIQLLFLLLIANATLTAQNQTDFHGKWIGEDAGEIGYIIFDNEGYAAFEIQGELFGGKEFVIKGEKGTIQP